LARYVAALIKKDKPEDELRKICLKKLQIFLQARKKLIVFIWLFVSSECVYVHMDAGVGDWTSLVLVLSRWIKKG